MLSLCPGNQPSQPAGSLVSDFSEFLIQVPWKNTNIHKYRTRADVPSQKQQSKPVVPDPGHTLQLGKELKKHIVPGAHLPEILT
jgi:hypothetical protein